MRYTVIELSGIIRDTGKISRGLVGSGRDKRFRYDRFITRVEEILRTKAITRVLIDCKSDFRPMFFAGLEGIRRELCRLAEGGKILHFFGRDYSAVQLYLSSSCNRRYINLCGSVSYPGLSRTFTFYRGLLNKYGIETQVFRRGKYKSANDSFRVKKLDSCNKEQWEKIHSCLEGELEDKILAGYTRDKTVLADMLNGRIYSSREGVEAGWVDEILTPSELESRWKKDKIRIRKIKNSQSGFGSGTKAAVLHFEGGIMDGHSRQDPLMGQIIGSDSFIPEINKLKKSRSVKGVVLRINCPGGSAVASDEVVRALEELAEKKPLVVSMGDVAGSGGYWISTVGRRIFTERTTLTGSIGVIALLFQMKGLMKNFGIHQETLKTAPMADLGNPGRAMTPAEKKILDNRIETLYEEFLTRVSCFRDRDRNEIHAVSQGRVWTGEDAVRIGLADEIGGLREALDYLKDEMGEKKIGISHYPVVKASFIEKQLAKANPSASLGSLSLVTPRMVLDAAGTWGDGKPLALMDQALNLSLDF